MSSKEAICTDAAPAAIGPYSQAVRAGEWLFVSGQIPLDPKSGRLLEGGIKEQTAQVFDNITAVLKASGLGLEDVVKMTVYMADLSMFAEMNSVYAAAFEGKIPPARAAVGVSALPKGALVEIEAVAYIG